MTVLLNISGMVPQFSSNINSPHVWSGLNDNISYVGRFFILATSKSDLGKCGIVNFKRHTYHKQLF